MCNVPSISVGNIDLIYQTSEIHGTAEIPLIAQQGRCLGEGKGRGIGYFSK